MPPTHIIRFKLPQEQEELDIVLKAGEMESLIHKWEDMIRSKIKYTPEPKATRTSWQKVQESWFELKTEYDL